MALNFNYIDSISDFAHFLKASNLDFINRAFSLFNNSELGNSIEKLSTHLFNCSLIGALANF
jgi:hypothetical protein